MQIKHPGIHVAQALFKFTFPQFVTWMMAGHGYQLCRIHLNPLSCFSYEVLNIDFGLFFQAVVNTHMQHDEKKRVINFNMIITVEVNFIGVCRIFFYYVLRVKESVIIDFNNDIDL